MSGGDDWGQPIREISARDGVLRFRVFLMQPIAEMLIAIGTNGSSAVYDDRGLALSLV